MSSPYPPQDDPANRPAGQPPFGPYPTSQPYPPTPPNPPSRPYPASQPYPPSRPYPPPSQPYPAQPYPGQYSQPYPPPGQPPQPYPTMPQQPWPGEAYPGSQPWPGGIATMTPYAPVQPQTPWLAEALPRWMRLALVGVLALFALAAFIASADWAAGAMQAGWVLGAAAILVVLATGIRAVGGMARAANPLRRRQFFGAGLTAVILFALSGAGIGLQSPEHRLQALVLEKQNQFAPALQEYQLAGERAPGSHDLARVYDAWGEQQTAASLYAQATGNFDLVITTYTAASAEVRRAETDINGALLAWGNTAADAQDYTNAVKHYDDLLSRPYCQGACQTQGAARDATAYYHLGETALASGNYVVAVMAFHTLLSRFAAAPETALIHRDTATALLGLGAQQRSGATCSQGLADYQELATTYADTPEGKTAISALKAPEPVIGSFDSAPPKGQFGVAILAKNLSAKTSGTDFYNAIFAPTAPFALIKADGSFAFAPVKQGTYDLVWLTVDPQSNQITSVSFYIYTSDGSAYYVAQVGPICPFDFGAIKDPLYSPPTQSAAGTATTLLRHISALNARLPVLASFRWSTPKRLSGR